MDALTLKAATIPIGIVTTIIGGSMWLTTTRNDVTNLQDRVQAHVRDYQAHKIRVGKQGEVISKIDGKMDMVLKQLQMIERRLNDKD